MVDWNEGPGGLRRQTGRPIRAYGEADHVVKGGLFLNGNHTFIHT